MINLDEILKLLRDSGWHSIEQVKREIPLPDEKLNKVISFLQEQGFISKEHEKLKITSRGLKFLEIQY